MGWNSWNTFAMDINEEVVVKTAENMVKSGLKDAGYEYVVVDDCWSLKERDKDGKLVADPEKFPHGMKWLKIRNVFVRGGSYLRGLSVELRTRVRRRANFCRLGRGLLKVRLLLPFLPPFPFAFI